MDIIEDEQHAAKLLNEGNLDEAVNLLAALGGRGSEYALITLGWLVENGKIGGSSRDAAQKYYERAQELGSAGACLRLGCFFLEGNDQSSARKAFGLGAERGSLACISKFGRMLVDGSGGASDTSKGLAWLEIASKQGSVLAKRKILSIRAKHARSWIEKVKLNARLVPLIVEAIYLLIKEKDSERLQ